MFAGENIPENKITFLCMHGVSYEAVGVCLQNPQWSPWWSVSDLGDLTSDLALGSESKGGLFNFSSCLIWLEHRLFRADCPYGNSHNQKQKKKGEDAEASNVLETESCSLTANGKYCDTVVKNLYKTTAQVDTWFLDRRLVLTLYSTNNVKFVVLHLFRTQFFQLEKMNI